MHRVVVFGCLALVAAGCGEEGTPPVDGGVDAARVDGGTDAGAGPACEPSCAAGLICCPAEGGDVACTDWNNDPHNCGECGSDCVAEARGTHCASGSCVCGSNPLGCAFGSVCCPPPPDRRSSYCANLLTDSADCGACNQPCDPARADRCDNGRCLCGELSRSQCDGTPGDTCCTDVSGQSECVDINSDRRHCGECENGCGPGLRCQAGECVAE